MHSLLSRLTTASMAGAALAALATGCTTASPEGAGGESGETLGPYGPRESDAGSCCYIVGKIACDGRPLLVEGAARVARVQQRLDWLS